MLLEQYPIRGYIPFAASDEHPLQWPDWWPLGQDMKVVLASYALIALPTTFVASSQGRVIVSQKAIEERELASPAFSVETINKFPCLVSNSSTGTMACYAHPFKETFYYTTYQHVLLLSTSLHDLCRVTANIQPNPTVIADFLFSTALFQSDPSASFIAGIQRVPSGACLTIQRGNIQLASYWHPHRDSLVHTLEMKDAVHHVRTALHHATARAIGNANRVGIYYSGGVDSSTAAGLAHFILHPRRGDLLLFSAGEDIATPEEVALQRTFAQAINSPLYEIPLDLETNILPLLRQANRIAPTPSNGLFAHVNEVIARAAYQHGVEVMLSGEGGEEVFGENDGLLADLLQHRQWIAAYHCLGYLTSLSQNMGESLLQSGLKPLVEVSSKKWAHTLLRWTCKVFRYSPALTKEMLVPLYGIEYAAKFQSYQERAIKDLRENISQGWIISDYQALQSICALSPFDHQVDYLDDFVLKTTSPLADPEVFQASLLLKPAARIHLGIGFRNKALLRYAASPFVPAPILNHPKINVADLPWRVLHHHLDAVLAIFSSNSLHQLGIHSSITKDDFLEYPSCGPLPMIQLLILAIWLEELQYAVEKA